MRKTGAAIAILGALATLPAAAQSPAKPDAALAAQARKMFPDGQATGREGAMKLGERFYKTVIMRSVEQCRADCLKNPVKGELGCLVWSFVKNPNPREPSVCRMWPIIPANMKDNPNAVTGHGKLD